MQAFSIATDDVDSLTADGRVVHIRDLRAADEPAVLALHEHASDRSLYSRYFALDREAAARYVTILLKPVPDRHVLGAFLGPDLVGVGEVALDHDGCAEFALLVADSAQHAGVGTLLLEHLVAEARGAGIRRLVADVLSTNGAMLDVIRDLGFHPQVRLRDGDVRVEFDLDVDEGVIAAIAAREETAGAASLRPLLAPRSVAVVGAGHRPGTVGHEVLRNLLGAGFTGQVYAVNPNRVSVLGVPCAPSVTDLPTTPDLAVIALPAALVADAVRACGQKGVRAAVLLGAGFSEAGPAGRARQDEVLAIARGYGLRLLGPNCIGVLNSDPEVRMNATFAAVDVRPGQFVMMAQSGAFGAGLLASAATIGFGVGQFASIGNKVDVGGNDLLLAWEHDAAVAVIGGYLESVGDPRRFVRIARRVTRRKPVLLVKSGRSEVGRRAGRSHTAAAASSDVAIDALCRAAGVVRVQTTRELLDAARVLTDQPLPAGRRVAVVGNSGGPEILAADAATAAGLDVCEFDAATAAELATLGAPVQNPIDLGAAVQADVVRGVLDVVTRAQCVDAVLTVFTDVAISDPAALLAAVGAAAASTDKPVVAVRVGRASSTYRPSPQERPLPVFGFPEEAATALGAACRYAELRDRPTSEPSRPAGLRPALAREIVRTVRLEAREWLSPEETVRLLAAYGVQSCAQAVVDAKDVTDAAARLSYPLAVKITGDGLHKTDRGGVRLDVADETELVAAAADLAALGNGRLLLQPMVRHGTELIIGAVHDPQCGPLVMVGAGGTLTDVVEDRTFGLAPLTAADAADMVDRLRMARLLDGYRGAPVIPRSRVADVLVRVAALVDDVPEIAELDLNPLIGTSAGLQVVDARVRIAEPPRHPDPYVRQLRGPLGEVTDTDQKESR